MLFLLSVVLYPVCSPILYYSVSINIIQVIINFICKMNYDNIFVLLR